ncbi:MAG: hypothetical protein Q9201_006366 [Fulgogasparrea decipioides]
MLASIRHFFRFIDLDEKFDSHGFRIKKGATFKLNAKREAYTDFIAGGGPQGYAYNVVRSEADDLIFKHAAESGAQTFDQTKVESLEFAPAEEQWDDDQANPGRPIAAKWSRKDGSSGVIKFDDLIDASGRVGLVNTKYYKNRKYNQGLKNIASWGYYKNCGSHAVGTYKEGQPYFEALADASGWVWTIPLHDGTTSVGVVRNQEIATQRKKEMGSPSSKAFFEDSLQLTPGILKVIGEGELVSDIKNASDWSYSAASYASPHIRIAGDAGCFIDPFFSSGVHLALASGLSAATTICASRNGECDEVTAAKWHSKKVSEGYTRFLLVVLSALKQIRNADEAVLSDFDEDGFDRAFDFFRPIIQGHSDTSSKLSQDEISDTIDFCMRAFIPTSDTEAQNVLNKVEAAKEDQNNEIGKDGKPKKTVKDLETNLTEDEKRILTTIRARQMLRIEDIIHNDNLAADVIDGMRINLVRGQLGLSKASAGKRLTEKEQYESMTRVYVADFQEQDVKVEEPAPVVTGPVGVTAH